MSYFTFYFCTKFIIIIENGKISCLKALLKLNLNEIEYIEINIYYRLYKINDK
jgi:hypothetical protein